MLSTVAIRAGVYCMPWRLRGAEDEPVHGGQCCYCGRDIAIPASKRGWHAACVYCGLDRSELPETEAEAYGPDVPVALGLGSLRKG